MIKLLDRDGNLVAKYGYDSWGKIIYVRDGNGADVSGNASHIANINPIRYRSYYYDRETDLYYLNSRYYDPETGRFLNADDPHMVMAAQDLQGLNLYAYCNNDPVNNIDEFGYSSIDIRDYRQRSWMVRLLLMLLRGDPNVERNRVQYLLSRQISRNFRLYIKAGWKESSNISVTRTDLSISAGRVLNVSLSRNGRLEFATNVNLGRGIKGAYLRGFERGLRGKTFVAMRIYTVIDNSIKVYFEFGVEIATWLKLTMVAGLALASLLLPKLSPMFVKKKIGILRPRAALISAGFVPSRIGALVF
ncbi:MAG: RHS repeat-associated core domain-containing protein [Firmicutes bacterium]|nr:RHS repeat-associated core domain-containing protein [Bacillota bacterium]